MQHYRLRCAADDRKGLYDCVSWHWERGVNADINTIKREKGEKFNLHALHSLARLSLRSEQKPYLLQQLISTLGYRRTENDGPSLLRLEEEDVTQPSSQDYDWRDKSLTSLARTFRNSNEKL
ncbi:hypothetical protein RRG08_054711 [Elysia crispata]|uniref:Uncharacterized protein n=1 Tax=Elysia crispata TaxID=231223 RepID=A0AAE1B0Z3_9GAST|nr:hypothetical protein RRG08_054711 [Elysia crispata]